MAARDRHDPSHFYDLAFEELAADPVGVVQRIYERFGLPWTDEVRAAVEAEDAAGRSGSRAPAPRYSLDDFGLTPDEVDERFAAYTARYLNG
jgi:LPS sulfotransferase NodH